MKTNLDLGLVMGLCLFTAVAAQAQFSSGSTGADGPLNVTTNTTLSLPPDGIFNFTTITITQGATLSFNPNVLNTPVYLLATSNVVINGDISVNASGQHGGPGG